MEPSRNSAKLIGGDNKPKVKVVRPRRRLLNKIPNELLNNPALKEAMTALPSNYNFELYKSIWRVQILRDKFYKDNNNTYHDNHKESEDEFKVALQFPEGAHVFILGDVTYGACCIDDFTASKLGAHFLIHYGHSCLVPVNETRIDVLYVFVELSFDIEHVVNCIVDTFPIDTKLAIMGTIQFGPAVYQIATKLKELSFSNISIPQAKPLSMGETLGCTSPILSVKDYAALVFIADGRFHLESAMIQNPDVKAYRYDPYGKSFTIEGYDTEKMKKVRWSAIMAMKKAKSVGVILGTLGRQGNPHIFENIRKKVLASGRIVIPFLMAELNLKKLHDIQVDAWVQVACPRLSLDWGAECSKPLLTPYELEVALDLTPFSDVYPMDYYREEAGPWGNKAKPEIEVEMR